METKENNKKMESNNSILKEFDLGRKGYKIYQSDETFCFGIDSVLLSWFAKCKKTDSVLDLGTGTGIIPLLIEARYDVKNIVAIDILEQSIDMARKSIELNHLEDKIKAVQCDLKDYYKTDTKKYDVVTSNPPYMIVSEDSKIKCKNENENLLIARHEIHATIEDVIVAATRMLKSKGKFYIVYKPDRLVSLMYYMRKHKIEPKRIKFVMPYENKESNIVLVEGVKDGKESLIIEPPLVVYESAGKYTKEILSIYND